MIATRPKTDRRPRKNTAAPRRIGVCGAVRHKRRGGAVILEFILAMPVLFISFLAIFQFGFLALLIQSATAAVVEGAREGALDYGNPALTFDDGNADPTGNNDIADRIALEMDRFLAVHNIEIRENLTASDSADRINAYVRITRAGSTAQRGDTTQAAGCVTQGDAAGADECVVTLCFPLVNQSATSLNQPIPDWLSTFGFSFETMHFEMTARAVLE